jgi:hypothetical protein
VLHKCANPGCGVQFRYLRGGRLFEVETRYRDWPSRERSGMSCDRKVHLERFWLCDNCAVCVTLRFDRLRGLILGSTLAGQEQVLTAVILQSDGRSARDIGRLLIRSVDLNFPSGRSARAAGESKVRG